MDNSRTPQTPRAIDYVVLAIAAAHWPLGVMARNYWQLVHPERVMVIVVASILIACLIAFGLTRVGVARHTAVFTVLIGTVLFTRGGPIMDGFDGMLGWAVIILPVAGAWWLSRRMGDDPAIDIVSTVLVVALASGPFLLAYETSQSMGESRLETSSFPDVDLVEKPDVYLVVLDGYPGLRALEQELGLTKDDFVSGLEARGFQVPDSAWSAYWTTDLAVPSLLEMTYPTVDGDVNNATRKDLHDIIGGHNGVVDTFNSNGYETIMIESGWAGSQCGDAFDSCVPSPWLDDLAFLSLWDGVMGRQMLSHTGHAYTVATQGSMNSLLDIARSNGSDPRFVFAHLIAPHPPFFLDEDCETAVSPDRFGDSFFRQGVDESVRVRFFVEQMACVDGFMSVLADAANPDDVIAFVADHGTDRKKYLLDQGIEDEEAVVERLNVFLAARLDPGCSLSNPYFTVNLMRDVFSCYGDTTLDDVEARAFLPDGDELFGEQLFAIVSSG